MLPIALKRGFLDVGDPLLDTTQHDSTQNQWKDSSLGLLNMS